MNFDVIIIGGSIAGASTARLLGLKGYKILMVERARFPRDTNSTHFIWPRGLSYLNRFGLAEDLLKETPHFQNLEINIEGISLKGSVPLKDLQQRFRMLHGDDAHVINLYCGPRRYFLDNYLLNAAKKAEVEVRENSCYLRPVLQNNRVIGITISESGKNYEARAPLVIGADGRFSKFARDIGAKYKSFHKESTFAWYGYFEGINRDELAIYRKDVFGIAIFPTLDNRHLALVYGPDTYWPTFKQSPEEHFFNIFYHVAPQIAKRVSEGNRSEPFKGCSKMEAFQRQVSGPGWALIGDAASFKDQVTAMGITHALRDAELITQNIHHAFTEKKDLDEAMQIYAIKRASDYDNYFNFVCETAKMKPYSLDECNHFSSLLGKPDAINHLISCFSDTAIL